MGALGRSLALRKLRSWRHDQGPHRPVFVVEQRKLPARVRYSRPACKAGVRPACKAGVRTRFSRRCGRTFRDLEGTERTLHGAEILVRGNGIASVELLADWFERRRSRRARLRRRRCRRSGATRTHDLKNEVLLGDSPVGAFADFLLARGSSTVLSPLPPPRFPQLATEFRACAPAPSPAEDFGRPRGTPRGRVP